MTITINDTGISKKRRRVLKTEGFASDIISILYISISHSPVCPNATRARVLRTHTALGQSKWALVALEGRSWALERCSWAIIAPEHRSWALERRSWALERRPWALERRSWALAKHRSSAARERSRTLGSSALSPSARIKTQLSTSSHYLLNVFVSNLSLFSTPQTRFQVGGGSARWLTIHTAQITSWLILVVRRWLLVNWVCARSAHVCYFFALVDFFPREGRERIGTTKGSQQNYWRECDTYVCYKCANDFAQQKWLKIF